MPTVDEVQISFDNQVSRGADAATASLNRTAAAIEKATALAQTQDQVIQRVTKSHEQSARSISGAAAETARAEPINRRFEASVQATALALQKQQISEAQAAEEVRRHTILRDQSLAKAKEYGQQIESKFVPQNAALAASTSKVSFAMRDLGLQSIDAFQGLATGQPVFRTLIQQGAQVYQVNQAMGVSFGQMAKGIASAVASINPFVAIGVVAAGAVVALGAAAEASARNINQISVALQATRDDAVALAPELDRVAKSLAAATSIGTSDARKALVSIGSASNFSGDTNAIQQLVIQTNDLAAALGITLPQATEKTVAAMKDPAKALQELSDKGFKNVSLAAVEYTKRLQSTGDAAGAFAVWQNKVAEATGGAAEKLKTPIQGALDGLSKELTKVGQDGRSFADSIGGAIDVAAKKGIDALAALVRTMRETRDYFDRIGGRNLAPGETIQDYGAGVVVVSPPRPVLTNPLTGAAGIMGVLPDAPDSKMRYGQDITTPFGNVWAGFTDLLTKLEQAGGVLDLALKNYGGFVTKDPTQYIAAVKGADARTLPPDVAQLISDVARRRGVPQLTSIAQGIAVVESGGRQFATSVGGRMPGNAAGDVGFDTRGLQAASGGVIGGPGALKDQAEAAAKLALSLNDVARKAKELKDQETLLNTEMGKLDPGTDQYKELSASLDLVHRAQERNLTESQQSIKSMRDQADLSGIEGSAAQRLADVTLKLRDAHASAGEIEEARSLILRGLSADLALSVEQTSRSIAQNKASLPIIEQGGIAVENYNGAIKAQTDALAFGKRGTAEYNTAVVVLTASNRDLAASERDKAAAVDVQKLSQQIEFGEAELRLVGATVEQRNRELAVLKERQALGLKLADQADTEQQKALDLAAANANLQTSLRQNQQALNDFSNMFSQAFSTVGDAITQALVQGQGAAISWRNVMTAVATQVLKSFLQLAVISPVLNSLFNQSNTTLGGVITALGSTGVAANDNAGGGSGLFGQANNLLSVGSAGSKLFGFDLGESLGLSGPNGYLSGIFQPSGFFGSNGTAAGIMNSGLFGTSTFEASALSTNAALAAEGFGAGGASGVATAQGLAANAVAPTGLFGGASLGTLAGGIGGGFTLGSLAGGFIQGGLGKTGPAPMIGAAGGAVAGAIIGSVVPIIGTVIGGIIGGLVGGAGGGFIGPGKKNAFSSTGVGLEGGRLTVGGTQAQLIDASQERAATLAQADTINAYLTSAGITLTSIGNITQVGQNTPGGFQDPSKFNSIADAFSQFQFASPDSRINSIVGGGRSFANAEQFVSVVAAMQQFVAVLATSDAASETGRFLNRMTDIANADIPGQLNRIAVFATQTVPALTKTTESMGSLHDAFVQINNTFAPALETARELAYGEQLLTDARAKAIATAQQAAGTQIFNLQSGLVGGRLAAEASLYGDPAHARAAALYAFDAGLQAQRDQLTAGLTATFGDAIKTTQFYTDQLAYLEATFGIQRLAIAKQYDGQILSSAQQTAQGTVTSLTQYLRGLQGGAQSALSPTSQYALASRQFDAVSGAARAGDFSSLQQLPSYADSLLQSSRAMFGSGSGYAADFNRVLSAIGDAIPKSADALTAAAFVSETRTATAITANLLQQLVSEVQGLRLEMQHAAAIPKAA